VRRISAGSNAYQEALYLVSACASVADWRAEARSNAYQEALYLVRSPLPAVHERRRDGSNAYQEALYLVSDLDATLLCEQAAVAMPTKRLCIL